MDLPCLPFYKNTGSYNKIRLIKRRTFKAYYSPLFRNEVCEVTYLQTFSRKKTAALSEVFRDQWRTQEFCFGGRGCSTNSVEDRGQREPGSGSGSPLVRGSGGGCNLVQEISFHIVKLS